MRFNETYQRAINNNISVIDLDVAVEVSGVFGELVERSSDDFEMICGFVKTLWLKDEKLGVWQIALALYDIVVADVVDEGLSIDEILINTYGRDVIDLAYEKYY